MMKYLQKNESNISVVIPTLNNRSQFLNEALNSIKNQTYKPLEVIIVNNGNSDLELNDFSFTIKKFKIKYKSGVSQARNFGASHASSEFIAFLDDDDLWPSEYLSVMKNYIEQQKPDCLIASLSKLKDGKISDYKNIDGVINKDIILTENPGITGSSVVVRKKIFFRVGGYNTKLITGEDKSLILEFINNNSNIIIVPETKAIHREHYKDIRLSNVENMAKGVILFYKEYSSQMNTVQKLDNLYKIKKYNWAVKKTFINGVNYLFFLAYFFLKNILKKLLSKKIN